MRAHSEVLKHERILPALLDKSLWPGRFEDVWAFERYLARNGVAIRKCFLDFPRTGRKSGSLPRLDNPQKNWQFSAAEIINAGFG